MRDRLLLAAAGATMLLTQIIAVREIGSTFFSTEIVLVIATVIALIGPSIGYVLARVINATALTVYGVTSAFAVMALPFGLRAMVGSFTAWGGEDWALVITIVGGALMLVPFYAVFLPRLVRQPASLGQLYAIELAGALVALTLLFLAPNWRFVLGAHWLLGVVVIHLGLQRWKVTAVVAGAALALMFYYPRLDVAASEKYLIGYYGHQTPRMLATEYSPYQRIDILDDGVLDDGRPTRSLYLDGVPFYRAGDLDAFNVALARLPGSLVSTGRVLVIGSGSFSSAAHLHRQGHDVTVVELDGAVARLGFRWFQAFHRLAAGDVKVVIDDGRRFLHRTAPGTYDLIVMDVPAPYHVRTALLHTPDFYRLAASRLRPGGVVAVSLCGSIKGEVGGAIAQSAASAFGEIMEVESKSVGLSVLYGGTKLPFTPDAAMEALRRFDPKGGSVRNDLDARLLVAARKPLDEDRLFPVLVMAAEEMRRAFHNGL